MILNVFTDGASRGNPGHAGIGVVAITENNSKVLEEYNYIGMATNNVAEYSALIRSLELLPALQNFSGYSEIRFHTDSELMERQLNGVYRVKDEALQRLFVQAKSLLMNLPVRFSVRHIPRHQNSIADLLANKGINSHLQQ